MPFKPITTAGSTVTARDDAILHMCLFGAGACILNIGSQLEASVQSANKIRISDGVLMFQGHFGRIEKDDYEDIELDNGKTGETRTDLIVAHFEISGGEESFTLRAIKGATGGAVPSHEEGDLYAGDDVAEIPVFRVEINGLAISKVTKLLPVRVGGNIFAGTTEPPSSLGEDGDIYIKYSY